MNIRSLPTLSVPFNAVIAERYDLDLSEPFSLGAVPAARTFMNLFNVSNQNGAPRDAAIAVRSQPTRWVGITVQSQGNTSKLNSRMPGNELLFQAATNFGLTFVFIFASDSDLQSSSVSCPPRRVASAQASR